jgi:hypothetical protein
MFEIILRLGNPMGFWLEFHSYQQSHEKFRAKKKTYGLFSAMGL